MTLTDDEIRIKVAEAMGYQKTTTLLVSNGWRAPNGLLLRYLPSYPLDLNACAEMVNSLTGINQCDFARNLEIVVHGYCPTDKGEVTIYRQFCLSRATARQRCLAYLKTKGILP